MAVVAVLLAFFIGALTTALYINRKYFAQRIFVREGIPGPKPHWLFGNALEFADDSKRHLVLPKWSKIYGKIYGFYEGSLPMLVISDVDFVGNVFVKHFDSFHGRKLLPLQADGDDMKQDISIFPARGERWKRLRTIVNPTFSTMKMRALMPLMTKCQQDFMALIEKKAATNEQFDILLCFRMLTMDTIAETAFGVELNSSKALGKHNPLLDTIDDMFKAIGQPPFTVMVGAILPEATPLLRVFELFRAKVFNAGFLAPQVALGDIIHKLIDTRKALCDRGENKRQDMLQMMIDLEESSDNPDLNGLKGLSLEEITGQTGLFMAAGYETSSNALAFITFMLANHPQVQDKLIAEIDTFFAEFPVDKCADYDSVADLPYLECVINESLRLYPIAPLIINRLAMTDAVVNGIRIPKGVCVMADVWSIHRDEEQWGPVDPEKFYPERFQDDYPTKQTRSDAAFLPFGFGPRICIGMRFALLEIKLTFANLLRKYRILKSEKTGEKVELSVALTITPINGIWVKLEKRT